MSLVDSKKRARNAPPLGKLERAALMCSAFIALSALAGAFELLTWPNGNRYLPLALLARTPFHTFVVPGVLLGVVVGGTAVLASLALLRNAQWASESVVLAGGVLSAWIACEVAMLRTFSWLQLVYGVLGISQLVIGLVLFRRKPSLRGRWIVGITAAESLGYVAPALAGILSARYLSGPSAVLSTSAGFIEGLCLGFGQATLLPLKVSRRRFVLATAIAASTVWASVFGLMQLGSSGLSWKVKGPLILVAGLAALSAIGVAQWLVLRRVMPRSGGWIAWTALAWTVALPMSFLPGPLVDEATPLATHVVLWCLGGVLMAYVMAWGTWFGVARLSSEREYRQSSDVASS
jgi:hypothetical protein